ncbi:MAG TPA: 50S ribosomal protein L3, partial [Planctomycetes bacterium]|nr:50S ribosomal protein L3 [Planctomycetota bacterium]
QNLVVVKTDPERGLLMIRGAVPGSKGGWVLVRDAVLKKAPADLPRPGAFKARNGGAAPEAAVEPKENA